jgi:uncharacterized membrane protein YtjA (UPF0391 family)
MLKWIVIFVLFAAVAGILDFKGIVGTPIVIEQAMLYVLLISFFIWLISRIMRGSGQKKGK